MTLPSENPHIAFCHLPGTTVVRHHIAKPSPYHYFNHQTHLSGESQHRTSARAGRSSCAIKFCPVLWRLCGICQEFDKRLMWCCIAVVKRVSST